MLLRRSLTLVTRLRVPKRPRAVDNGQGGCEKNSFSISRTALREIPFRRVSSPGWRGVVTVLKGVQTPFENVDPHLTSPRFSRDDGVGFSQDTCLLRCQFMLHVYDADLRQPQLTDSTHSLRVRLLCNLHCFLILYVFMIVCRMGLSQVRT